MFTSIFAALLLLKSAGWHLEVGLDIQNTTLVGFDWLSEQVAMVKAVIKAIKAAGVGLNGSSDCPCCHKQTEREREQDRMGKT